MDELIKAMTAFFREGADWFAKQNAPRPTDSIRRWDQPAEQPPAEPKMEFSEELAAKTRKPRAKKQPPMTATQVNERLADAGIAVEPVVDETQSRNDLYKACTDYIAKDASEANRIARQAHAKKYLADIYKVSSIKELTHADRLEFTEWIKDQPTKPAL